MQERHCYRAWFSSDPRSEVGLPTVASAIATEHGSRRMLGVSLDCQLFLAPLLQSMAVVGIATEHAAAELDAPC